MGNAVKCNGISILTLGGFKMKYGKYSKNGMLIIESRYIGHSSYSIYYNGRMIGNVSSMGEAMNIAMGVA